MRCVRHAVQAEGALGHAHGDTYRGEEAEVSVLWEDIWKEGRPLATFDVSFSGEKGNLVEKRINIVRTFTS